MEYASRWRRVVAYVLDGFLVFLLLLLALIALLGILSVAMQQAFPPGTWMTADDGSLTLGWPWSWAIGALILLLPFLVGLFYFALAESSGRRGAATPGKRMLGIWVADLQGGVPTYWQAAIRYGALLWLPPTLFFAGGLAAWALGGPLAFALSLAGVAVGVAGPLMTFFGNRRQALHDWLSRTVVLRVRSPTMSLRYPGIAASHTGGVYRTRPRWLEATMRGPRAWTKRGFLCALLCLVLGVGIIGLLLPPPGVVQWWALNAEVTKADRRGAYTEGIAAGERALALARQAFGPANPATLASLNNLAVLYEKQGRYDEAEQLQKEALEEELATLGPERPSTLISKNNLAGVYRAQGRYNEAERLYKEALEGQRRVLGPTHSDTLASLNNLAMVYRAQGRYGDAERLYKEALEEERRVLGSAHPTTLTSLGNLAEVYQAQGRYGDAEPLYKKALEEERATLGSAHPNTLMSLGNLAGLYQAQGRYGDAEPLYNEALEGQHKALGSAHPNTLNSLNNLALLYGAQGRYDDAERLYKEALEGRRKTFGSAHPDTLVSLDNLAQMYREQGRYDEAEQLYEEALEGGRAALGPAHPDVLLSRLNWAANLAALGRITDAVHQLQTMETPILDRLGTELYASEAPGVRRSLVASQASYQDVALNLALRPGAGSEGAELAATTVLRLKSLQAEEEAFLAHLARRGEDPHVRELVTEIAELRSWLAALVLRTQLQAASPTEPSQNQVAALGAQLQAKEFALSQASREYAKQLQVRSFDPAKLRTRLPPRTALLELRQYQPYDFRASMSAPPRWAGLLVTRNRVRVVDLGPMAGTDEAAQDLLADAESGAGQRAAQELYKQLISPLAAELAGLKRLYLAPDGALNLVPFAALLGPDGRRLAEVLDLRLLQTGRDLLRKDLDRDNPSQGLLALGNIDFGPAKPAQVVAAPAIRTAAVGPTLGSASPEELRGAAAACLQRGFIELPATAAEVHNVEKMYRAAHPSEPVEVWEGTEASEARLRAHRPPRVLHLATHGFYCQKTLQDRPMLLAGVALANANVALREAGQDGILHAIEAQDLDLEGTELVVLSACETGLGQIDYGEGVSGLVRALRTAGARHVLVTLHGVSDPGAADFMERFYRHWLAQRRSDPAAAFRAAQLEAIAAPPDSPARRDQTWAQFVIVGG
jgi:CHAT domain-containing protein/uncharacterized RDD family membrane protein YckC/Flp pilus assembly protein TadD